MSNRFTPTYEDGLELLWEKKDFLCGRFTFRVYRSRFSPQELDEPIEKWRYHFGFPEDLVKPLAQILETTVAWGRKHWKEHEGFWLWWLTITGKEPHWNNLNRQLDFMMRSYNQTLKFYQKAGSSV